MNNSENESINIEVIVPMLKLRKILPFTARGIVRKLKIDLLNCQELQSLEDGWNFGFFMPGNKEKAGKYLDEERFLNEYFFNDNVKQLQFIQKKRIYRRSIDMVTHHMHNNETKRKKFLECVKKNDIKKTNQLISDGLDPNFIDPTGEVTPLIAAVLQKTSKDLIYALVEGGAHLDFRNKQTLTPLHVAAMKGKDDAVKLLLELGSSANYRDGQMLTPLYVGVKHDITKYSLKKLCYEHADTDVVDNHDNTSLHQACRLGKYDLLEDLIAYSRDINKQNHLGNTALHLAAVQKQEECTKMLLERGANKYIVNHSGKTAADLCTSKSLKQFIQTFEESQKIQNAVPPKYNLNRKVSSSLSNNDETLSNGALISSFSKSLSNLSKKEEENDESYHEKPRSNFIRSISLTNEIDHKFSSQKFNNGKIRNHKQSHIINGNSDDDDSDDDCSPPLIRKKLQNYCRIVTINPGHEGLGFILRGAAGTNVSNGDLGFSPSDGIPALQYFEYVQPGSVADKAGIKKLDFLAEINGEDVRSSTHAHTVSLLKNAVGELQLVIITVPNINETFLTGVINPRVNYRNEMNKPRNFKFHDHSLGILEPLNESPEEDICEISEKCNAAQLEDQNIVKKITEIEDDTNFEIVFIDDPQIKPVVQPRKFLLKPSNSSQPPKPILPSEFVTKSKSIEVVSPLKEYRRQELSINNIVSTWSVNDVTNFLISLGLLQHVNNFKIGKVDGFKLQQLKRQDFIHLGVDDVTHRMHIERGILKANRTMSSC